MDLFGNIDPTRADVQYYWPSVPVAAGWKAWNKPRGRSYLEIICIGGGGGGAGGSPTNSVGGGGGGSGGISRYLYPLQVIPDVLYVNAGSGGTGGASDNNGTTGNVSAVSLYADSIGSANTKVAAANGGFPGTAIGAGGNGGSIATNASAVFSCWAITTYIAGVNGTAGGSAAAGADLAIGTASMILSGTGGGATGFAGGNITAVSNTPFATSNGGAINSIGNPGFIYRQFGMSVCYGGTGGGGGATTGGAGGYGCVPGAGGGGGGQGGTTGGRGGDGGPGLVIMISW
jgi:hypothetical protein